MRKKGEFIKLAYTGGGGVWLLDLCMDQWNQSEYRTQSKQSEQKVTICAAFLTFYNYKVILWRQKSAYMM
jgi:hypothetical protein